MPASPPPAESASPPRHRARRYSRQEPRVWPARTTRLRPNGRRRASARAPPSNDRRSPSYSSTCRSRAAAGGVHRLGNLRGHLIGGPRAVNDPEGRPAAVVLDERFGLAVIDLQTLQHDCLPVVSTLNQRAFTSQAAPRIADRLCAFKSGVGICTAAGTNEPGAQPPYQLMLRHHDVQNNQRTAAVHDWVERHGLRNRTRETVEYEAVLRVGLFQ